MATITQTLTPAEREALAEAIHHRNLFDHDHCDHGTYTGGPSHGKPYAMCERMAGPESIVTAAVERILAGRLAPPPCMYRTMTVSEQWRCTLTDGHDGAHDFERIR